nr:unnamed protein product [Spirometra erinaceieuropaei]
MSEKFPPPFKNYSVRQVTFNGNSPTTAFHRRSKKRRRRLGTPTNVHKLAIRRRGSLSLVFAHELQCDHRFDWDDTEVIVTANTKRVREFLEAWHSNADSINRHVDLDAHYEGLTSRPTKPSSTPHQRPLIQTPAVPPTFHSPSPPTRDAVTVRSPPSTPGSEPNMTPCP